METNPRSREGIAYEVLTEFSQVVSISSDWDSLLERSRCNRAFSCSTWYMATRELYPSLKPVVLVARYNRAVAGIMPLVVDAAGESAGFHGSWSGDPDIIAEDDDIDVIVGLLRLATSDQGYFDKLLLKRIRRDSNCFRALKLLRLSGNIEGALSQEKSEVCSYADLSRGYDEYMRTRSKNFRHNLSRVRNKAHRHGVVVRELAPTDFDAERIPGAFMRVHSGRFGEGTVLGRSTSFLNELFPYLFTEGRIRAFALLHGEQILGMHLSAVGKNSLAGWNAGFLPEAAALSPGRLLLDEAIRQACIQGFEEYDFREGEEKYKEEWRTDVREIVQLEFTTRRRERAGGSQ